MGRISRWNRAITSTILLAWLTSAHAQLVEAECWEWPTGIAFPDSLYVERARNFGFDVPWREFAARDAIRAGRPPASPAESGTLGWTWLADRYAIARTTDLGVFVSRTNTRALGWQEGISDGYIVSAWAFVSKGTPKVIATAWLHEKSDRPVKPPCENRLVVVPGNAWSRRKLDFSEVAAATAPPAGLRDADNSLIAAATCRERWPPIIAASGENRGTFLIPKIGEVRGGARLRPLLNLLPDEPVRWRRLKFLSSRDETLGLSIGRLENCDDPKATQTYISVWVRDGKSWRLELLAIAPGGS